MAEEIDLTADQQRNLDSVWDAIHAENAKAANVAKSAKSAKSAKVAKVPKTEPPRGHP